MATAASTPRVVVVDVRNGKVRADGANIDLPPEGQESFLRSLETADVIVEVHEDTLLVTQGYDKHIVLLGQTKTVVAMNYEKADREKADRTDNMHDDLEAGEHPVEVKFKRVWDGSVPSGDPEQRGLKGF
jgi:hypothetical protein